LSSLRRRALKAFLRMKLLVFSFLVCLHVSVYSQGLQLNSYASDFKKNNVHSRFCKEIRLVNGTADSIYISKGEFNEEGLITKFTAFFAGKRRLFEERFEYNSSKWPVKSYVSHAFHQWEELELQHVYDEKGTLTARVCPIEIRNFWTKEEYIYDSSGRMIKCIRYHHQDGAYHSQESEEYSATIHSGENTPTYIHDHRGLLVNQQIHGGDGTSKSFLFFEYQ